MKHHDIITQIESLDLSVYPYAELKGLLRELGKVGVIITTLHPGKSILRARLNDKNSSFCKISELSYKPQEFNNSYLRASTPNKTMFYGSIVPEVRGITEPETASFTTILELSEFARSIDTIGEQKITFSSWEVQKDIRLLSLIFHQNFQRPTELTTQMQSEYKEFVKQHPELEHVSLDVSIFLGDQFAKDKIKNDFDYMVSAVFSEIATELGLDGVLYPSVKLAGEGINIALTPNAVDTKLKFVHAGECTLYKNEMKVAVGNDTYASINSLGGLDYNEAPVGVFVSKEFGRGKVGLKPADLS